MTHVTLLHRLAAGLVLLLSCSVAFASKVEQDLRSQYCGKVLAERSFLSGEHLMYDSAGAPSGGGRTGDWTTDGFVQIKDIHLSGKHLKIKANRLMVVSDGRNGFRFAGESASKKNRNPRKAAAVEIDAATGSDALSDEAANRLLSKIFLNSQDSFSDTVPLYWKSCIDEGVSGKNQNCRFSAEMLAVPGVTTPSQASAVGMEGQSPNRTQMGSNATLKPATSLSRVGNGVSPPRAIYQPEPGFSEPARKARYQGTLTLALVVDRDGLPQQIRITNPLGAGLDAKAVEAVSTWKFRPAEKDGQPVAVVIAVEVDFHLY
jgi:TonB family protein